MYLRCEVIAHYVLPIFRSLVAKELIEKYNFTQVEAAKRLGTTQAAISQYIRSKRGYKRMEKMRDLLPEIQSAANEVARQIATKGMRTDELMESLCKLCATLQPKKDELIRLSR